METFYKVLAILAPLGIGFGFVWMGWGFEIISALVGLFL